MNGWTLERYRLKKDAMSCERNATIFHLHFPFPFEHIFYQDYEPKYFVLLLV